MVLGLSLSSLRWPSPPLWSHMDSVGPVGLWQGDGAAQEGPPGSSELVSFALASRLMSIQGRQSRISSHPRSPSWFAKTFISDLVTASYEAPYSTTGGIISSFSSSGGGGSER